MKLDFKTAKEQVAKENGHHDWKQLANNFEFWEQVATKMAQSWANEAVKEDRKGIVVDLIRSYDITDDGIDHVKQLPLPYPEQL